MSELEFLGALHVELLRHRELAHEHPRHELFQTSTVQALLAGAFDGDVTLGELLDNGDLGLGTLDGLDGELEATAYLDDANELHVELPPAVDAPPTGAVLDAGLMRRLEGGGPTED